MTTIESSPEAESGYEAFMRAGSLLNAGQLLEAAELFLVLASRYPGSVDALFGLGNALCGAGQYEGAIQVFTRALAIDPNLAEVHANLGNSLCARGRVDQAEKSYLRALELAPERVQVLLNLGNLYRETGRLEQAGSCYREAIKRWPNEPDAHCNLGNFLRDLGRLDEAISAYERALKIEVDHAATRENRAYALLAAGQFGAGFAEYEWRWRRTQERRPFDYPLWQGEALNGKSILLCGEQGIGDEIMFASLVERVSQQAHECILECDPRLVTLFTRSFPQTQIVARSNPPARHIAEARPELQSAVGSLPRWCSPHTCEARAYLVADQEQTQRLRAKYLPKQAGFLVGISWRSGNQTLGKARSLPLCQWYPILRTAGVTFVDLQYGDTAAERRALSPGCAPVIHDANVDPLVDMDRFAAQAAAMDLVISIDNSTVHVSGALGIPTWILLDTAPSWRWLATGESSYWYASVRLVRQWERDDWAPVVKQVAADLQAVVAAGRGTRSLREGRS